MQAIDPTAPILPIMPATPARLTHDYVRHGTTSLFAALDLGSVIAQHYRRHRHQEFLRFLKLIDADVPADLVLDNHATDKTEQVKKWLIRHPRFHLHFTPTSASSFNLVECWFAVALDADERSRLTSTDQMLGTLAYMAPEQFRGRYSPASDLYALGCVLYQMLSGQGPFQGPDHVSLMHAHIYEKATPVGRLRPDVPSDLEALVERLLAKAPEARPVSANEVFDALHPHTAGLRELPGAVRAGRSALRMYADVAGRTLTAYTATLAPSPPPDVPPPRADSFSLGDVARARRCAERLLRESRFDEAARMLSRTSTRAESVLGGEHSEVVALRTELADVLFKGGDYPAAASAFHALAQDAARRDGAGSESALRFRLQEAGSRALGGEIDRALAQLKDLIGDEARLFGKDDARVLDLRRQQGLLLHGAGRTSSAVRVLEELAADLERLHGPDDRTLQTVRETLDRLRGG